MAETKTVFTSITGKARGYKLLMAVLVLMALVGLGSFIASYIQGHQLFGSSNIIPWGMPIVFLIYLIGLSAGSLILSSLTYVFGREQYKPIARVAVFLAVVLIFAAMIFIFVDLGRPEKFWRLFMFFYMNNMSSMFAINGVLYGGYFVLSLTYLGFIFWDKKKYTKIMGTIAVCWAVLVHMGTGGIFGFIAAREAWFSPIKPLEFLSAALTSGMALLIVAVVFTLYFTRRKINREMIVSLSKLLVAFIGILLLLITVDKITHFYSPHREATVYMLAGQYSWIFWGLQIGMGAFIPLVILLNPRLNTQVKWIVIASMSVVIGVFFERWFLVIPGAAYPMHVYPGHIEGVWGMTGTFAILPAETLLSLGIVAIGGIVFLVGLRYLELLPPPEPEPEPLPEPAAPADEEKPAEAATEEKPEAAAPEEAPAGKTE